MMCTYYKLKLSISIIYLYTPVGSLFVFESIQEELHSRTLQGHRASERESTTAHFFRSIGIWACSTEFCFDVYLRYIYTVNKEKSILHEEYWQQRYQPKGQSEVMKEIEMDENKK